VKLRGFPHFLGNRLTDGGEVVRLTHCTPLAPGRLLVLISVRGRVNPSATVRLEGLSKMKSRINLSAIEPATFRLVV
jgi:hypothetical protein